MEKKDIDFKKLISSLDPSEIENLPPEEQEKFGLYVSAFNENELIGGAQKDFLTFVKALWPHFVEGTHHRIIAEKFNRIADGTLKRLIVNMPPRHTKSEFASFMYRHLSWAVIR